MGLMNTEGNENETDLIRLEMDIMNATGDVSGAQAAGAAGTFACTIFIAFDEDDDNSQHINLRELFKPIDSKLPPFVEVGLVYDLIIPFRFMCVTTKTY